METNTQKRATAFIIEDSKILMIRHARSGYESPVFPGGGVDEGETVEQALVREMEEELTLKIEGFEFLGTVASPDRPSPIKGQKEKQDCYCYLITKYSGVPKIAGWELVATNGGNKYS